MNKEKLNKQLEHWDRTFSSRPEMFGASPSRAARVACDKFKKEKITNILELGAGQGRDSIFFAQNGISVHAIDYSNLAVENIIEKSKILGLSDFIKAKQWDIRKPLPFKNETFKGCYSHMLYCMALTTAELEILSSNLWKILKPDGLNIYTARHTGDGDYKNGIHRGEDLYENEGFIVHFFSEEKVKKLSKGFSVENVEKFEEGKFPRKLFNVTLRKK